jgi:hypothetical protein
MDFAVDLKFVICFLSLRSEVRGCSIGLHTRCLLLCQAPLMERRQSVEFVSSSFKMAKSSALRALLMAEPAETSDERTLQVELYKKLSTLSGMRRKYLKCWQAKVIESGEEFNLIGLPSIDEGHSTGCGVIGWDIFIDEGEGNC